MWLPSGMCERSMVADQGIVSLVRVVSINESISFSSKDNVTNQTFDLVASTMSSRVAEIGVSWCCEEGGRRDGA